MDLRTTVERLAGEGIQIYCLALDCMVLSPHWQALAAVAELERDLLIERLHEGAGSQSRQTLGCHLPSFPMNR